MFRGKIVIANEGRLVPKRGDDRIDCSPFCDHKGTVAESAGSDKNMPATSARVEETEMFCSTP
jgi:hypothetical protein